MLPHPSSAVSSCARALVSFLCASQEFILKVSQLSSLLSLQASTGCPSGALDDISGSCPCAPIRPFYVRPPEGLDGPFSSSPASPLLHLLFTATPAFLFLPHHPLLPKERRLLRDLFFFFTISIIFEYKNLDRNNSSSDVGRLHSVIFYLLKVLCRILSTSCAFPELLGLSLVPCVL